MKLFFVPVVVLILYGAGCAADQVTPLSIVSTTTNTPSLPVAEQPPLPVVEPAWTITMVGDIMLDRNVRTTIQARGFEPLVANIKKELVGDVVVGNLEGPFTNSTTHAVVGGPLSFTFEPSLAKKLKQAGFTLLSLANNHTLNQGVTGLTQTRSTLQKAGLEYFGDPANKHGYGIVKEIKGMRIAFIGHHGLVNGLATTLSDIREATKVADVIIVMPHQGTEYNLKFTPAQQREFRQMIDAGASMVIAAHPHVVEPIEIYKGRLIAYSLGNFIFDQYFSVDTQQGLLLHINGVGKKVSSVQFVPLQSKQSVMSFASSSVRTSLLRRISNTSIVEPTVKKQLLTGTIYL